MRSCREVWRRRDQNFEHFFFVKYKPHPIFEQDVFMRTITNYRHGCCTFDKVHLKEESWHVIVDSTMLNTIEEIIELLTTMT
jgi:hypothetical protein